MLNSRLVLLLSKKKWRRKDIKNQTPQARPLNAAFCTVRRGYWAMPSHPEQNLESSGVKKWNCLRDWFTPFTWNKWLAFTHPSWQLVLFRYSDNTQMSCCDHGIAWLRGLRGYGAGLVHPHLVRAVTDQVVLANISILTSSGGRWQFVQCMLFRLFPWGPALAFDQLMRK